MNNKIINKNKQRNNKNLASMYAYNIKIAKKCKICHMDPPPQTLALC